MKRVHVMLCGLLVGSAMMVGCTEADPAAQSDTATDTTTTTDDTDTTEDGPSGLRTTSNLPRPNVPDGGCFMDYNMDRNGDGFKDASAQVVYDANGNWLEYRILDGEDVIFTSQYTYDDADNMVQLQQRDRSGEVVYVRKLNYDDAGNAIAYFEDEDNDGFDDNTWTATYDADGNRTSYKRDDEGDGLIDSSIRWTFDDQGRVLSYEIDSNDNGFVNYVAAAEYTAGVDGYSAVFSSDEKLRDTFETYTWDESDNLATYALDYGNDGSVDVSITTFYNADSGAPEYREYDRGADDSADLVVRINELDDSGRVTKTITETPAGEAIQSQSLLYYQDGNLGSLIRYDRMNERTYREENNYNEDGKLSSQKVDDDGDGTWDGTMLVEYSEEGNTLSQTYNSIGNNDTPDTPELAIDATDWDEDGNAIAGTIDRGNDGEVDGSFAYTYDENGNVLTELFSGEGDAGFDYVENVVYDDAGNVLRDEQDYYGDGTTDKVELYTYDDEGNALTYSLDDNGDGTLNEKWEQSFDADGYMLYYQSDSNADDRWDFSVIAQTECLQ